LLLVSSILLVSCTSVDPGSVPIPQDMRREGLLYGYGVQTATGGTHYSLAYHDLEIRGKVNAILPDAVEGYVQHTIMPFRGNARYEVDFDVGGERLAGRVSVELTSIDVDLKLGDVPLSGFIDERGNSAAVRIVFGSETARGTYARNVVLRNGVLVAADYAFRIDEGDLPLHGQISYKKDAFSYRLAINGRTLEGTATARGLRSVYQISAVGLTRRELSLFLLVDLLKRIPFDSARYHSKSN
jgi:hypothetical protein